MKAIISLWVICFLIFTPVVIVVSDDRVEAFTIPNTVGEFLQLTSSGQAAASAAANTVATGYSLAEAILGVSAGAVLAVAIDLVNPTGVDDEAVFQVNLENSVVTWNSGAALLSTYVDQPGPTDWGIQDTSSYGSYTCGGVSSCGTGTGQTCCNCQYYCSASWGVGLVAGCNVVGQGYGGGGYSCFAYHTQAELDAEYPSAPLAYAPNSIIPPLYAPTTVTEAPTGTPTAPYNSSDTAILAALNAAIVALSGQVNNQNYQAALNALNAAANALTTPLTLTSGQSTLTSAGGVPAPTVTTTTTSTNPTTGQTTTTSTTCPAGVTSGSSCTSTSVTTESVTSGGTTSTTQTTVSPPLPSTPTFDTSMTTPNQESIPTLLSTFLSTNPIISAINGSHMTATGSCTQSTGVTMFGNAITIDWCWMQPYLETFGTYEVIFAGLTAALIIFRRDG